MMGTWVRAGRRGGRSATRWPGEARSIGRPFRPAASSVKLASVSKSLPSGCRLAEGGAVLEDEARRASSWEGGGRRPRRRGIDRCLAGRGTAGGAGGLRGAVSGPGRTTPRLGDAPHRRGSAGCPALARRGRGRHGLGPDRPPHLPASHLAPPRGPPCGGTHPARTLRAPMLAQRAAAVGERERELLRGDRGHRFGSERLARRRDWSLEESSDGTFSFRTPLERYVARLLAGAG